MSNIQSLLIVFEHAESGTCALGAAKLAQPCASYAFCCPTAMFSGLVGEFLFDGTLQRNGAGEY